MEDLVSIIMPNYNCSEFICMTVSSVINQTYKNWELIFIDDKSSDNSLEIINMFSHQDKRIRIYKNDKNMGAAYCRNLAIREANGRWIAFLDSDDLWSPSKLKDQLDFMKQHNYHFSYTKYSEIDEHGSSLNILITGPSVVTKKMMFRYCYLGCLTVMYDSHITGLIQIPDDITKRNDYALWLKVIKKTDKCYYFDKCLSSYRRRKKSISSGSKFNLIKYHYELFKKSENMSSIKSFYHTLINLIFGVIKKIKYVKHI